MAYLVIYSTIGDNYGDQNQNWTKIVAVEASELEARKHLTDDYVEWPTDEQSVFELNSHLDFNPAFEIRIERWVSTQRELVCSMIRQADLDASRSV